MPVPEATASPVPGGLTSDRALSIIGAVLIAVGLLWVGQGTRVIPWPEVSPMIGVQVWVWRGLALALVGVVVLLYARRQRPWWRRWF